MIEDRPPDRLNSLIEKHNMYYSIEADLRMDPGSCAPMMGSVPWEPGEKITAVSLLELFPQDISYVPA